MSVVINGGGVDATAIEEAAISALGGAGATTSDEQLRNWAGQLPGLLTSVSRTSYSDNISVGWIQIVATVTWPDGTTGHLDGVEYPDEPGVLQYFTASHTPSGKIVVKTPYIQGVSGITVIHPNYYVDSNSPSGGSGTLALPYNTFSNLPSLSSGEIVALKSGSTFFEDFPFPNAPISIYRYSSGAKPIIDARNTIQSNLWSVAAGTATYSTTITYDPSATGITSFVSAWQDGTRLPLGSGAATLTSGQYYVDSHTSGSTTLYVRASDDGNLIAGSSAISFSARHGGLDTTQASGAFVNGNLIDGIITIGCTNQNGSGVFGESTTLRHCEFREGQKHAVYYQTNSYLYGLVCTSIYYNAACGQYILNQNVGSGDVKHYDCASIQSSAYATPGGSLTAFNGHRNTSGDFGTITYSRPYISGGALAWTNTNVTATIIVSPYVLNVTGSIVRGIGASPITITNLVMVGNVAGVNCRLIEWQSGSTSVIKVTDGSMTITAPAAVNTGAIYNNYANVTVVVSGMTFSGTFTVLANYNTSGFTGVFSENKYQNVGRYYDFVAAALPAGFNSNNNRFCNGTYKSRVSSTDYDVAAWKSGFSQDLASIVGGCV